MASYFIGVDVGTGSARAGVFDLNGRMVGQASRAIDLYRPKADSSSMLGSPWSIGAPAFIRPLCTG